MARLVKGWGNACLAKPSRKDECFSAVMAVAIPTAVCGYAELLHLPPLLLVVGYWNVIASAVAWGMPGWSKLWHITPGMAPCDNARQLAL